MDSEKAFIFEFSDNFSITNFFSNLVDRIDFLLPPICPKIRKDFFKLSGEMHRSKIPHKTNSICTLKSSSTPECSYLINGTEIIKADSNLNAIISKLNLMYAPRQSYSAEGIHWITAKDGENSALVTCATIYSGSEAANILIRVKSDEIMAKVFPDFVNPDSNMTLKLVEIPIDSNGDSDRFYFDLLIKTIKINFN